MPIQRKDPALREYLFKLETNSYLKCKIITEWDGFRAGRKGCCPSHPGDFEVCVLEGLSGSMRRGRSPKARTRLLQLDRNKPGCIGINPNVLGPRSILLPTQLPR